MLEFSLHKEKGSSIHWFSEKKRTHPLALPGVLDAGAASRSKMTLPLPESKPYLQKV